MKTHGDSVQTFPVLARAAAQILLKINAIRYDAVSGQPFTLDLSDIHDHPHERDRLVEMIADILFTIDPNDVCAADLLDADLCASIATRLHLPKVDADGSRMLPVSWRSSTLHGQDGFAVFHDRLTPRDAGSAQLYLTTWQDVLDVLRMSHDNGHTSMRFALASKLRA